MEIGNKAMNFLFEGFDLAQKNLMQTTAGTRHSWKDLRLLVPKQPLEIILHDGDRLI